MSTTVQTLFIVGGAAGLIAATGGAAAPIMGAGLGAGVGSGVGVGAAGAAGGLSMGTVLSGAFTGFSALSALRAGTLAASQSKAEANQLEMQAKQLEIQGLQQTNEIRRDYLSTVAAQKAAYASQGVDLGSGSIKTVRASTDALKEEQLRIQRGNTATQAAMKRYGAGMTLAEGEAAKQSGQIGAVTALGDFAFREFRGG